VTISQHKINAFYKEKTKKEEDLPKEKTTPLWLFKVATFFLLLIGVWQLVNELWYHSDVFDVGPDLTAEAKDTGTARFYQGKTYSLYCYCIVNLCFWAFIVITTLQPQRVDPMGLNDKNEDEWGDLPQTTADSRYVPMTSKALESTDHVSMSPGSSVESRPSYVQL